MILEEVQFVFTSRGKGYHPQFQHMSNSFSLLITESFVYICDFHREQSWMRWLSKIDNGAADAKDKVISMLRRCAHAVSVEDYQTALSSLQGSTEWVSNGRLRQWFSRTWIPEYKVYCY